MRQDRPGLLIADRKGNIFEHPRLEACGMAGGAFFSLKPSELIKLPGGSQLFKLPDRRPVSHDPTNDKIQIIDDVFAVAAFIAPGHAVTASPAYKEDYGAPPLPLFSYAACAMFKGQIYVSAVKVDADLRHDTTLIDIGSVKKKIDELKKRFPKNRLIEHLARCALVTGCPNAQNFFLGRYEAPLPGSPSCNAECAGCISLQKGRIKCSQPRIKFIPYPEELSGIALFHIANVKNAIVSFGQGCEGEPLLQGRLLEKTIGLIRGRTRKGTINLNTNGSIPETLSRLFDAGLDSVRISMNSAREKYYTKYYDPKGYDFSDVLRSIEVSKKKRGFISINYLTIPGFTDSREELTALATLLNKHRIDMIQWRNLNYDPMLYFRKIGSGQPSLNDLTSIRGAIKYINKEFPRIKIGYFNPAVNS